MNISVISVYAPTNQAEDQVIDAFYDALEDAIRSVPMGDFLIVAGDFNAQLGLNGARRPSGVVGRNALGTICANGERLYNLAAQLQLSAISTNFQHKRRHLVTWQSPDGRTSNQIDPHLCQEKMAQQRNQLPLSLGLGSHY